MYSFAFRLRWIVMHLVIVAIAVLLVSLGLWQLRRHDERAAQNATVAARSERPAVTVDELLAEGVAIEDLRYRPVRARGAYLAGGDVLVDNRSLDGRPGAWVVTPLQLDDGDVVAVARGFTFVGPSGRLTPPPAPAGPVAVEATVVAWDGNCGVRTGDDGRPVGAACLHRDAVEAASGTGVLPLVLQRVVSEPADHPDLLPVPLPEPDAGPHRSYAAQWFIFCALGLVTYPLLLRKIARQKATEGNENALQATDPAPNGSPPA